MLRKQLLNGKKAAAILMMVFAVSSCNKGDRTEPSSTHLTRQTALTADEAVTKPGIYEQTYVINDKVYKVDVKYYQNSEGKMVVEPVTDSKDINDFLQAIKGKNYSITQAPQAFGTYILHDSSSNPATINEQFKKYISPKIQVNLQAQKKLNTSLERITDNNLVYFKIDNYYSQQRAAKKDFAYATFYENINFGGRSYAATLNGCDNIAVSILANIARAYGTKSYIGNSFNDLTSSFSVNFNDGLGSMTTPQIDVRFYQDQNFGGCATDFIFTNPNDPSITVGMNVHNVVMWAVWWSPTQYWNDRLSSYYLILQDVL
ncbi:hypothetical protein [Taibaiella soli]|uniref:Uncharacterized protein n=1 Tax=Taibaiella soli TaxID=1649169 RepID=A0A2W2ACK2_9BACT|nr:hypothetical protein [Taibaiella soli]PZF73021.1 hypothetical protein DN068_11470 [Taibaiella soli]